VNQYGVPWLTWNTGPRMSPNLFGSMSARTQCDPQLVPSDQVKPGLAFPMPPKPSPSHRRTVQVSDPDGKTV
jgi:hypothetical protein